MIKKCPTCGKEFERRYSQKYCVPACSPYNQPKPVVKVKKTCIVCGRNFMSFKFANVKMCSDKCRKVRDKQYVPRVGNIPPLTEAGKALPQTNAEEAYQRWLKDAQAEDAAVAVRYLKPTIPQGGMPSMRPPRRLKNRGVSRAYQNALRNII